MATTRVIDTTTPSSDEPLLFEAQKKIYPQKVHGTFRRIKWIVLVVTLGIYYLLPFVRWDRGPDAPNQAVLIDFVTKRFYFFGVEIWPQEFYYITGLLILAALILFLMNAVAGRVWCGYLCPQTVWTDLFLAVERLTEGDRRDRIKRDNGPLTLDTILRRTAKHTLWLIIAWWTGGAWVLYFADAPTLVWQLATFTAPAMAYVWIGILTFTTYTLAGHMREQVCLYMCPWPRIQAALTDEEALNVTYRYDRGEPRGSVKRNAALRAKGEAAGDCIDCYQCVNVCPTGVDIRHGSQLGCIQCGLCIDACDTVMEKIGRPTRLIAYDTDRNVRARTEGKPTHVRLIRWRTLAYVAIIAVVGSAMLYTLLTRSTAGINVLHDRNPVFVRLSDGSVRNAYTLRVINKNRDARTFELTVMRPDGTPLPGAQLSAIGDEDAADGRVALTIGPDQTREVRAFVTIHDEPRGTAPDNADIVFRIRDESGTSGASARDHFFGR
ncbi:cytochrome c oxidase accessory protein CcoG [Pseudochelatococcus lubricantis]|uniref:cytochrome c oxidase accessory protein CcoG n=1 Tax=Pseudochelatococcus lubricantis TaxID=1538102 RepID=UPI0035ECBD72